METRFVKPFVAPQMVVRRHTKECLGVFDGARGFDKANYALLKDGVVELYNYRHQQLYGNLEDVWIAPNYLFLIREKGSAKWKLISYGTRKCYAEGERAAVFCKGSTALVFLKQMRSNEWCYFDVSHHHYWPEAHCISADEIDVWEQRGNLYFILTSGEKTVLQYRSRFTLELLEEFPDVSSYACLPDGSIAVAEEPMTSIDGLEFRHVKPTEGHVMSIFSDDLDFRFHADEIVMTSSGAYLQKCGEEWSLFAGKFWVKGGIFDVESYAMYMSYGRDTVGRTADGKPVVLIARSSKEVLLDYGGERFYLLNGGKVIHAEDGGNVFFI